MAEAPRARRVREAGSGTAAPAMRTMALGLVGVPV